MANSTTNIDTISTSQANKEATANAFFDAASQASTYGRRASTSSGLTWGYYGGNVVIAAGTTSQISNGTLTLTGSTTCYIVAAKADGAVSFATNTTNWDNDSDYWRLYAVVTGSATVTSWVDHRCPGQYQGAGGGGGMANPMTTAGDLIYGGTGGAAQRLSVGTEGQVLKVVSGNPAWDAESGAAANISYDNTTSGLAATQVQAAIDELAARPSERIGVPFFLWDHLDGVNPPDNSGAEKYIRLTAGQTGSGQYNEGLLTNESVSGTAPLVEATAEIAAGPLAGEVVHLINTEEAFVRARETSGALQFDQMQRITGEFGRFVRSGLDQVQTGALNGTAQGTANLPAGGTDKFSVSIDSANSPDARASTTTSGETRSKNVSATCYMRIE